MLSFWGQLMKLLIIYRNCVDSMTCELYHWKWLKCNTSSVFSATIRFIRRTQSLVRQNMFSKEMALMRLKINFIWKNTDFSDVSFRWNARLRRCGTILKRSEKLFLFHYILLYIYYLSIYNEKNVLAVIIMKILIIMLFMN